MSTDDKRILSQLCRNIRPVSKTDRGILLPVSNAHRQRKLCQTSVAESLDDELPGSVVGDYHAAVVRGARLGLHRGHGTRQLGEDDIVRLTIHGKCLVNVVSQQPATVANVHCRLCCTHNMDTPKLKPAK